MKTTTRAKTWSRALVAAVSLCAAGVWATELIWQNNVNTPANWGPETQINGTASSQRFVIWQGTANVNEGASIVVGGNSSSVCNFIGVERSSSSTLNINGGTVWCTTSGGGAGSLGVGNNDKNVSSYLNINSGILKVDGVLRSAVMWDDSAGATSSGTITINGGEAIVNQVLIGAKAQKANCGTSSLTLQGGVLTVREIYFRPYNGQYFSWRNGTIVAARANIFKVDAYAQSGKTRTMEIINGGIASFDTAGYDQTIPPFTNTGRLRLTGGGTVTFEQSTLTYGLILDGIALNLGTLDAGATRLTTPNLELVGPATLNVTLPASPTGRYPLIACTSSLDGSLGQITVSGGGAGVLVRDGNTIYLSFDSADLANALVYSAAAGGADTPAQSSYTRLAFTDAAGVFSVGGSGLTLSQDIADHSASAQTVTAPITLSTANSSIYVAEGGRLTLSGGLTATTPRKDGPGTLVLDSTTMPSTIVPREGTLDFGGKTYTGDLTFSSRAYNGEEITFTNGTWQASVQLNWQGSSVTVAEGFTMDLATKNQRIAVGNIGVDSDGSKTTKLIVDGGTVRTAGNNSNWCNFIAVDKWGTAILEVKRGTFYANGSGACIRIGTGSRPYQTGIVRVSGGLFKIDNDLTLGTAYNGTGGGTSKGIFELSGGVADVKNFYLGATSSTTGRGEVSLTGGVLEVGKFQCLAYNTQTLTADGATIRAKNNDTAAAPFMAKVASADGYAKSYTIGAGGLTIDTAGHDVHCDIPWTANGGLTVTGGGSLALARTLTFGGDGVLASDTTLIVTNSLAFGGKLTLGADAKIRIDTTSYHEDSLTISTTDGFVLPEGADDVLDFVELVGDEFVASVSADGKSIELGLAANVAAFAWWTGNGDPTDFDDPANWACTNSTGGVVENALPVNSTVVVLSGTTSFTVPAGTTPNWASTQIGNGGAVTLGADCDWAAAPHVTIADGSYIDLNGHNLKISYLTAAEGENGAYVTNSVAGTEPALWAENAFSEKDYIDTAKVKVYADCMEVKCVNSGTFTIANQGLGWAFDAGLFVTNGTTTVTGDSFPGRYGHTATMSVSGNAALKFQSYTRAGYYDSSSVIISVTNNATFSSANYFTLGHHNSGTNLFTQDGGTVTIANDFNIGVANTETARYEMSAGTFTVSGSLVPGRGETNPGHGVFTQRGGTVNANGFLTIAYTVAGTQGSYIMEDGTLNIPNQKLTIGQGASCEGLFEISGGTATSVKGVNVASGGGSIGTLRVCGNGRFTTSDIAANGGTATVEFNGGTVAARAANASFVKNVTNVVFGENAVTLDTAGYAIGFNGCVLKATPGARAITLTGGGTLDFTNTTLAFTEPLTGGFVVAQVAADDAATFTSVPALAEGVKGYKIKLSADGKMIKVVSKGLVIFVN